MNIQFLFFILIFMSSSENKAVEAFHLGLKGDSPVIWEDDTDLEDLLKNAYEIYHNDLTGNPKGKYFNLERNDRIQLEYDLEIAMKEGKKSMEHCLSPVVIFIKENQMEDLAIAINETRAIGFQPVDLPILLKLLSLHKIPNFAFMPIPNEDDTEGESSYEEYDAPSSHKSKPTNYYYYNPKT